MTLGDLLVAAAYVGFYRVMRENSYGAATIKVEADQKVVSTGPLRARAPPDV